MIVGSSEEFNLVNSKYLQFNNLSTIVEHVVDCFTDQSNPYHQSISWLKRKQPKSLQDELFGQCSTQSIEQTHQNDYQTLELTLSVRTKLEKSSKDARREIVTRTREGCSAFFLACKNGLSKIVSYLIETCDADLEQTGRYEVPGDNRVLIVTPIWVAAVLGHLNVVQKLIQFGANVNFPSDTGSTPLRSTCFMCRTDARYNLNKHDIYFDIIKLLIENKAEIERPNHNGGTCLINSIHNYDLTKFIISKGADVDASDHQFKTALHYAIQQGRLEVTKLLLSNGANPMLKTNIGDDALQLCCLGGHLDIFKHLIRCIKYPRQRIRDAHLLLGSSILELHDDVSTVRELWLGLTDYPIRTLDEFRMYSLQITEKILGSDHWETNQRFLCRGGFYLASSKPDRCLSLWIHALKLKLNYDSILNFESTSAAAAITRLILNIMSHKQLVEYSDLHQVLSLLIEQLEGCKQALNISPVSLVHLDAFDFLLTNIIKLLLALGHISSYNDKETVVLIRKLAHINPTTTDGSSLLHICVVANAFKGDDLPRLLKATDRSDDACPVIKLIDALIENGLDIESINKNGLSSLQALCLTDLRVPNKSEIIRHLVKLGAHMDRKTTTQDQADKIKQVLCEAGLNLIQYQTLSCLAASTLKRDKINLANNTIPEFLKPTLEMH